MNVKPKNNLFLHRVPIKAFRYKPYRTSAKEFDRNINLVEDLFTKVCVVVKCKGCSREGNQSYYALNGLSNWFLRDGFLSGFFRQLRFNGQKSQ